MEDFLQPPPSFTCMARRLWFHGFLAGFGVVLVVSLIWIMIRGTPTAQEVNTTTVTSSTTLSNLTAKAPTAPTPALPAPPPADTPATLRAQVEKVLARLQEANRSQNLDQVIALYAISSPEREQRAKEIAAAWKTFRYADITFAVEEMKVLGPGNLSARVVWTIEAENRITRQSKKITKAYQVRFIQEAGTWRIFSVEKGG